MTKDIVYKSQLGITIIAFSTLLLFDFFSLILQPTFSDKEIETMHTWDIKKFGDLELYIL